MYKSFTTLQFLFSDDSILQSDDARVPPEVHISALRIGTDLNRPDTGYSLLKINEGAEIRGAAPKLKKRRTTA